MIVDDEHATYGGNFEYYYNYVDNDPTARPNDSNIDFQEFLHRNLMSVIRKIHRHLRQDYRCGCGCSYSLHGIITTLSFSSSMSIALLVLNPTIPLIPNTSIYNSNNFSY
jgi:hypothetical protein